MRHPRLFVLLLRSILFTGLCLLAIGSASPRAAAQNPGPAVTAWKINTTGARGSSPDFSINSVISQISADVQSVWYDGSYAYIKATDIPSYAIGPFPGDPNVPGNQNSTFRIPRIPQVQAGPKMATGLGPIGVFVNGVALFNPLDANSYQNMGIWHQNAPVVEASSFDSALGHPAPGMGPGAAGIYHHHQFSPGLGAALGDDGTKHSPILGFAFDGYPVYGPFGTASTDGSGGIRRMRSSYSVRSITQRTTLPNGANLQPSQYGPNVSTQYPLGYYVEDYVYTAASGDLDASNGRFCVTPDYPQGTYAYFAATNGSGQNVYPYLIGPSYYGVVDVVNTNHSGVTIPVGAVQYLPGTPAKAVGDFNGDGNSDLLLQNDLTGDSVVWYMNASTYTGSYASVSQSVPVDWKIVGRGDLKKDGKTELIWRNQTTGDVTYWVMNGATWTGVWGYIAHTVPTDWTIATVADINGDGSLDLVWQNTRTGDVTYWVMNGVTWTGSFAYLGKSVPTSWKIVASGDLNGDRATDLIWQNTTTGDVSYWLLNSSGALQSSGYLAQGVPTQWKIGAAADYYHHGGSDLAWYNQQTGDVVIWKMNGTSWTQTWNYVLQGIPLEWRVVGPH